MQPKKRTLKLISFYTTGLFTITIQYAIITAEIRAMPGKEKEMILRQFSVIFNFKYQDLSLCSYYKMHDPLSCPYETVKRTVKRQP